MIAATPIPLTILVVSADGSTAGGEPGERIGVAIAIGRFGLVIAVIALALVLFLTVSMAA